MFLPLSTKVGESTVLNELVKKHPNPSPATPLSLINPTSTIVRSCHPVIFDCLDGDLIRRTAIRIQGLAGPSGVDALGWRCLCTSFRTASFDLCHSLASVAKRFSTSFVDPDALQPLLNCRLIALDKNPGVRPIYRHWRNLQADHYQGCFGSCETGCYGCCWLSPDECGSTCWL